jgi:ABC-type multidrug transport system ATPase subunit
MSEIPALQADELGKRYGSHWALRARTLDVPAGSVTALVGPNGAGKTTLLHLPIGLSKPSAGDVRVLGRSAREQPLLGCRGLGSWPRSICSTAASRWRRW